MFQPPIKRPKASHPIDVPEPLLAELSHLFHTEAMHEDDVAFAHYLAEEWTEGAAHEIASDGLMFDSKEIAYWAMFVRGNRLHSEERNLLPWERMRR